MNLSLALTSLLLLAGCSVSDPAGSKAQPASARTPSKIDGPAAKALVAAGAQLVDVRTAEEFASGHAEGARNIPIDQLGQSLDQLKKDAPVIVYCAAGVRAGRAATLLANAGYDARDLGSLSAWPR